MSPLSPHLILYNGQILTLDPQNSQVSAVAIQNNRFMAVGNDDTILKLKGEQTQLIDLKKRMVIPGLNDSHIHLIRGGLTY
ncbi:MAG: amidohydrolase, partial [Cyanobacteria bacterium]|nr:amidohydrolase [Cyanobacteriota bacterium]